MRPITFVAAVFGVVVSIFIFDLSFWEGVIAFAILIAIVIAYETVTGVISDRRHLKRTKENDEKLAAILAASEIAEEETK